jgi:hypothetical protein
MASLSMGKSDEAMPSCRRPDPSLLCLVPGEEAAHNLLILPQTPFTLTTGLAKCRKPISDGSLAHRHGQPGLA